MAENTFRVLFEELPPQSEQDIALQRLIKVSSDIRPEIKEIAELSRLINQLYPKPHTYTST